MKLLSRKFILTILVVTLSFVLVITGKLDSKDWLAMAVVASGIYSAANITQKAMEE